MAEVYRVSGWMRARRTALRPLGKLVFHLLADVRVQGAANVPLGKPYLVAVNHISIYDPPFLMSFWPEQLSAVGAIDVFGKPFQGDLMRAWGTVPVHRGDVDRALLDAMLSALRGGNPMMIAPEGGRSHTLGMRRARPGIAQVAELAQVPVMPVGIVGTTGDFLKKGLRLQRPRLELRIGKPVTLPPLEGRGEERRASRQQNADLVMQHIAALLPTEYHGVYSPVAAQ